MQSTAVLVLLCLVSSLTLHVARAKCPHTDPDKTFRKWSESGKWSGGNKPSEGDDVVISDDVLLDESPPELNSLTVSAGASLVFLPDGDHVLTVRYILLHGALHIGAPGCRFARDARIVLTGTRGTYNVPGFGEKFVGVAEGGILELHGKNKLSWTKLTSTVNKMSANDGFYYDRLADTSLDVKNRGFLTYILNSTGHMTYSSFTYIVGTSGRRNWEPAKLIEALNGVQDGDTVIMAVQKNIGGSDIDMEPIYDAIEKATRGEITDSSDVRKVGEGDAWVLIATKGKFVEERMSSKLNVENRRSASLTYAFPDLDVVVSVSCSTRPDKLFYGESNVVLATKDAGMPVLNVAHDTSSWAPGDRLLVTSTDFSWRQAEEAEVVHCPETVCSKNQVRVKFFPKYTHWGEVTDGVDMRAEVALLSHNVVIEGETEDNCVSANDNCRVHKHDTFGGHVQIEVGFTNVHIDGVELRSMGQRTKNGGYPIYFHMCLDVDDQGNYTHPAYVRGTSIVDSHNGCIVVGGTHGLTIQDTVAYNHYGHCYHLKEGGEKRTVLDGNLGVATRVSSYRSTSLTSQATTFLITNPLTYFRNNIAAGGQKRGIWYVFPDEPFGESKEQNFMKLNEAKHTPYSQFTNNAAHSYEFYGLVIDNRIIDDGVNYAGSRNEYTPLADPTAEVADTELKASVLHRYTGYKNSRINAYIKDGHFSLDHCSFSDGASSLTLASIASKFGKYYVVENTIIVGESDNIGEPTPGFPRSLPQSWNTPVPIQGLVYWFDGPMHARSVWFKGFQHNSARKSSALGFFSNTPLPSSAASSLMDLRFGFVDSPSTGTRIYHGDASVPGFGEKAGDVQYSIVDTDGSLTGVAGSTVIRNFPLHVTGQCYVRENWDLAVCPHKYGKLKVYAKEAMQGSSKPILTRDDLSVSEGLQSDFPIQYAHFPVILGGTHSYVLHWDSFFPQNLQLTGMGLTKDQSVRIGVCVPRDADLSLWSNRPLWRPRIWLWTQVDSISALDLDTLGDRYFWDKENGIIFFHMVNYREKCETDFEECKDGCPFISIVLNSGNRSDADCRDRIASYQRDPISSEGGLSFMELGQTAAEAPVDFGAGEFVPFRTKMTIDGGYGEWSDWSECPVTCGGAIQIRTRACDSPMPQNGGLPCEGPAQETQVCGTQPCEIHGGFSDWSDWSDCQEVKDNGVKGYHTRTRECNNPAPKYNGNVCEGPTSEMEECVLA